MQSASGTVTKKPVSQAVPRDRSRAGKLYQPGKRAPSAVKVFTEQERVAYEAENADRLEIGKVPKKKRKLRSWQKADWKGKAGWQKTKPGQRS